MRANNRLFVKDFSSRSKYLHLAYQRAFISFDFKWAVLQAQLSPYLKSKVAKSIPATIKEPISMDFCLEKCTKWLNS